MSSILKQFYAGEVYPEEQILPKDPNYWPTQQTISRESQYLEQKLSPEDAKHLEKLNSLFLNTISMTSYAAFRYGFKLATEMIIESLSKEEKFQ